MTPLIILSLLMLQPAVNPCLISTETEILNPTRITMESEDFSKDFIQGVTMHVYPAVNPDTQNPIGTAQVPKSAFAGAPGFPTCLIAPFPQVVDPKTKQPITLKRDGTRYRSTMRIETTTTQLPPSSFSGFSNAFFFLDPPRAPAHRVLP